MADSYDFTFTITVSDFDLTLLPEGARQVGSPEFQASVNEYLSESSKGSGEMPASSWARTPSASPGDATRTSRIQQTLR
jgi:hypothetical protein